MAEIQTREVEVTTTETVRGIFLTESDIRGISFPLYRLRNSLNGEGYSGHEQQAVKDLKDLIDVFLDGNG